MLAIISSVQSAKNSAEFDVYAYWLAIFLTLNGTALGVPLVWNHRKDYARTPIRPTATGRRFFVDSGDRDRITFWVLTIIINAWALYMVFTLRIQESAAVFTGNVMHVVMYVGYALTGVLTGLNLWGIQMVAARYLNRRDSQRQLSAGGSPRNWPL